MIASRSGLGEFKRATSGSSGVRVSVRQGSTIIRPTVALVLATTSTMLEVLSHALHMALHFKD